MWYWNKWNQFVLFLPTILPSYDWKHAPTSKVINSKCEQEHKDVLLSEWCCRTSRSSTAVGRYDVTYWSIIFKIIKECTTRMSTPPHIQPWLDQQLLVFVHEFVCTCLHVSTVWRSAEKRGRDNRLPTNDDRHQHQYIVQYNDYLISMMSLSMIIFSLMCRNIFLSFTKGAGLPDLGRCMLCVQKLAECNDACWHSECEPAACNQQTHFLTILR